MSQNLVRRLVILVLLFLLCIFFSFASDYFMTASNISAIFLEASAVGIIAVGMTFVIITAGIDLSVGSTVAFVAMACINMLHYTHIPVPLVVLAAIATGTVIGAINGLVITKFKIPDFIVTLASMGIFRGLTLLISIKEGGFVKNVVINNGAYLKLAGKIGQVYYITIVFIIVAAVMHIILKKTRLGIYTYATGADLKAAALTGINTDKIKVAVYVISGIMCAIASVFISARLMTATPEMGSGMEMSVIAAVIIGGTSFSGGKGDIIGTAIGAIFMAVVQNGIYKLQISSSVQTIIMGLIIIVSIIFDEGYQEYSKKRKTKSIIKLS